MFSSNCKYAVLLLFGTVIFISIFMNNLQFMNKKMFHIITRWNISHMLLYFILGSLCPNHLNEFMIVGLIWEIIERIFATMFESPTLWTSNGWKGQMIDLVMNLLGYKFSELFYGVFHI